MIGLAGLARVSVPVDPDAPEAEQWLRDELSKQQYLEAQPSWFDRLMQQIFDFIFNSGGSQGSAVGGPGIGGVIIIVLVVIIVVVAFAIFGLPRLNRKSRVVGALFGDDDSRTSTIMRKAATDAARSGDFALAIAEMYRAIARGLSERTLVTTSPGTTAHDFAIRSGLIFPDHAVRLTVAAVSFDEVRYLELTGSREKFDFIAALESDLRAAKPSSLEAVPS